MRLVPVVQVAALAGVIAWLATGSSDPTDTQVDWAAIAPFLAVVAALGLARWLGRRARPWELPDATPARRMVVLLTHRVVSAAWVLALVLLVPVLVGEIVFDPIG